MNSIFILIIIVTTSIVGRANICSSNIDPTTLPDPIVTLRGQIEKHLGKLSRETQADLDQKTSYLNSIFDSAWKSTEARENPNARAVLEYLYRHSAASILLELVLSPEQKDAIDDAHSVGKGNYSLPELTKKYQILKKWFSPAHVNDLLRLGIAGPRRGPLIFRNDGSFWQETVFDVPPDRLRAALDQTPKKEFLKPSFRAMAPLFTENGSPSEGRTIVGIGGIVTVPLRVEPLAGDPSRSVLVDETVGPAAAVNGGHFLLTDVPKAVQKTLESMPSAPHPQQLHRAQSDPSISSPLTNPKYLESKSNANLWGKPAFRKAPPESPKKMTSPELFYTVQGKKMNAQEFLAWRETHDARNRSNSTDRRSERPQVGTARLGKSPPQTYRVEGREVDFQSLQAWRAKQGRRKRGGGGLFAEAELSPWQWARLLKGDASEIQNAFGIAENSKVTDGVTFAPGDYVKVDWIIDETVYLSSINGAQNIKYKVGGGDHRYTISLSVALRLVRMINEGEHQRVSRILTAARSGQQIPSAQELDANRNFENDVGLTDSQRGSIARELQSLLNFTGKYGLRISHNYGAQSGLTLKVYDTTNGHIYMRDIISAAEAASMIAQIKNDPNLAKLLEEKLTTNLATKK